MEDKVIFALIGGFVGLITAIITSWLNKRAFREEIAESDILKIQIQDYKLIWDIITKINFETTQMLSRMANQMSLSGKKELKDGDQLLEEINKEYGPKSTEILVTVMTLRKYYVSIPVPLIEHLKHYEELIYEMFKQQDFRKFMN